MAPASGRITRIEHGYVRENAWTCLAAWDVPPAKVFGRCETKSGIAQVDRLTQEVISQKFYRSARRVFWIVGNCSVNRLSLSVDLPSQRPALLAKNGNKRLARAA